MATEKKDAALEAEVKETVDAADAAIDDAAETAETEIEDKVDTSDGIIEETAEKVEAETEEPSTEAEEAAESSAETAESETAEAAESSEDEAAEAADSAEEEAAEAADKVAAKAEDVAPVKVSSKRIKKTERREAKAARKAANKIEEKKSRPNNALIALLIFGVVIAMFAFVLGYNYFSKPANIEKYMEANGGKEAFGAMQIDAYTTANITAKGNSMNIVLTSETDDKDVAKQIKEFYSGDDGKDQLEYLAAYFLTGFKPQTRAFSADAKATINLNGEELNSIEMTYKEAKKMMEEDQKEAEEGAEDADDADAEDAADTAEDTADDAADAAEDAAESAEGED